MSPQPDDTGPDLSLDSTGGKMPINWIRRDEVIIASSVPDAEVKQTGLGEWKAMEPSLHDAQASPK